MRLKGSITMTKTINGDSSHDTDPSDSQRRDLGSTRIKISKGALSV